MGTSCLTTLTHSQTEYNNIIIIIIQEQDISRVEKLLLAFVSKKKN